VLRIGQEKNTHFIRLLLKGSMDERISELQQNKKQMCAVFMDERRAPKKARKLSMKRLSSFLGAVQRVDGSPGVVKAEESEEEESMSDTDETDDDDGWTGSDDDHEEESDGNSSNDESGKSEED
jgi:hypothetical protein